MSLPNAPAYNDGSIPYGVTTPAGVVRAWAISRVVSGTPTVLGTYIVEASSLSRPANIVRRKNQVNEPTGSIGQNDFPTGTATVQIATTSASYLIPGDYFSDTFSTEIGAESFIVTHADQPETQADYKKQTLQFIKQYH